MTKETVGQRVRRLRAALGLSQDALSKRAGVSATHVYQVESGKRSRLHLPTAQLYAAALKEAMPPEAQENPVDYLMFGYTEPQMFDGQELPDIEVYLRATTPLSERKIRQIVNLIREFEAELAEERERRDLEGAS